MSENAQDLTRNPGLSPATVANRAAFLAAFEVTGRIDKAAEAAGVSRGVHYQWLNDAEYAAAFEEAKQVAGGGLKDEARRRAVEGLRRYKFTKSGKPILHPLTGEPYYEDVRSDALLTLLLKAQFPDEFKDRSSVDVGSNRLDKMSLDELRERARQMGIPVPDSDDLDDGYSIGRYRLPHETEEGTPDR